MTTQKKRRSPVRRRRAASSQGATIPFVSARPTMRVLVATDGSAVAASAIRWARLMATGGKWAPEMVTVLEPLPVAAADAVLGSPPPEAMEVYTDSVLGRIRAQLTRFGVGHWPFTTRTGRAANEIVERGREMGAQLIVTGLGRHGKLARLAGAETAVRVARHSDVPVLAVEERLRRQPRTAVVAVDFGPSSIRAAKEALALLDAPGRLHLLHVRWAMHGRSLLDATSERTYRLGVDEAFRQLIAELAQRPGIRITSEMRLGGVVETTLATAKRLRADLIAAGSHSRSVLDRLLIGSTPSQLLRAAPCSMLVAPPEPTQ